MQMVRMITILLMFLGANGWQANTLATPLPKASVRLHDSAKSLTNNFGPGPITTFSIVAYDPETGDYGVGVQSKYFAVGDVVPFARADTGALATQARGNLLYGPQGLKLIGAGVAAEDVVARLIETDPLRESRQVGVIDSKGRPATYTGQDCLPWAGGKAG
jgi:hypothetical protein